MKDHSSHCESFISISKFVSFVIKKKNHDIFKRKQNDTLYIFSLHHTVDKTSKQHTSSYLSPNRPLFILKKFYCIFPELYIFLVTPAGKPIFYVLFLCIKDVESYLYVPVLGPI